MAAPHFGVSALLRSTVAPQFFFCKLNLHAYHLRKGNAYQLRRAKMYSIGF